MTTTTPARDQRGIITLATLSTWRGTDAELARALGVTRQAVSYARIVHRLPAPIDGRKGPRPGLSKTVIRAIMREAERRGTTIAVVLQDCHAWAEGVTP